MLLLNVSLGARGHRLGGKTRLPINIGGRRLRATPGKMLAPRYGAQLLAASIEDGTPTEKVSGQREAMMGAAEFNAAGE